MAKGNCADCGKSLRNQTPHYYRGMFGKEHRVCKECFDNRKYVVPLADKKDKVHGDDLPPYEDGEWLTDSDAPAPELDEDGEPIDVSPDEDGDIPLEEPEPEDEGDEESEETEDEDDGDTSKCERCGETVHADEWETCHVCGCEHAHTCPDGAFYCPVCADDERDEDERPEEEDEPEWMKIVKDEALSDTQKCGKLWDSIYAKDESFPAVIADILWLHYSAWAHDAKNYAERFGCNFPQAMCIEEIKTRFLF